MNAVKLNQILLKIVKWGVYIILFTPLFVTKHLYFPFISTKVFIFRIIIEVIFVIWLILLWRKVIKPPYWKNALLISIIIYLAVMAITAVSGVQCYRSFWGTMERGGGLFTYLHYFAFLLILITVFTKKKDWQKLLDIFLTVSLLVGLAALAQKLNLPLVYESGVSRATGSTGNAAHLASFLIFPFFLGGMKLLFSADNLKKKIFYAAAAAASFFGILFSQTRGAAVGLEAGVIVFLILAALKDESKKARKICLALLVIFLVTGGILVMNRDSALVKSQPLLRRLVNIKISDSTVRQRWHSWRAGWQAFKEKPVLGWGMENYNSAFNKYFDPSYYNLTKTGTYFDRAHNIVIELLATSGIIGLLSYFFAAGVILFILFKSRLKFSIPVREIKALIALLAAYFIQNLFVFDTIVTYLALVILIAYIYNRNYQPEQENGGESAGKNKAFPILKMGGLAVAIIFSVYSVFWLNVRPAISAYYIREALNEANKRPYSYPIFSDFMRRSLAFNTPWEPEYVIEYLASYKELLRQKNVDKKTVAGDVSFIVKAGEKYAENTNQDAKFLAQMAGLYEIIYDYERDEQALKKAEEYINQALALSSGRVFHWHVLAQIYEFNGRDQQAIDTLNHALSLNPEVGETYWALSLMYSKINNQELTIKNVKEAVKRRITLYDINYILEIMPIFEQTRDYESIAFLYETAVNFEPNSIDYRARLAAVYALLGKKEMAIKAAQEIISIEPGSIEQVNSFIKEVESGKYDSKQ